MGKKGFRKHGGSAGGGGGRSRNNNGKNGWTDIVRENDTWESYYRSQGIIDPEEWDKFKTACQTDLPLTFRITGSTRHAIEVREAMENNYIPDLKGLEWEGEPVPEPNPLSFYPDNLGWQVNVAKQVIRKNKPFARFQRFLVVETDVGNISRQEAVSMIPPLLLDIEPHHTVLDMCAAPGSKTAQLIEALHSGKENPTGFVLANDSDYKRSHMLIHQVKRLNSPNLVVTNHDAQLFPKVKVGNNEYLKFDRILCDVPCSGDGTMRKNLNVWKDWTVGNGLGLHSTQINILARGIQLLKHGGRLVYSTCSMNPIENESIVAEVLRQYKGVVSLVDVSDRLPGLVRNPGLNDWKVQTKDKKWRSKGEEGVPRTLFPPDADEIDQFHLERTLRIYPHQQDTGGFYIAVFEKKPLLNNQTLSSIKKNDSNKRVLNDQELSVKGPEEKKIRIKVVEEGVESVVPSPIPVITEPQENEDKEQGKENEENNISKPSEPVSSNDTVAATDVDISKTNMNASPSKKEKLPRDVNEEPFNFIKEGHPTIEACWKFYGIASDFPKYTLLVRNETGEPIRTIYYVAPCLRPVLELNPSVKFVHAGIKMFAQQKNEGECKWRVQSEGIELLYPYVAKDRVVHATSLETLKTLCLENFPKFSELERIDSKLKSQTENISEGCAFLTVPREECLDDLIFPLWRGRGSVNIMLPKQDTQEVLHRLFGVENVKDFKTKPSEVSETPSATAASEEVASDGPNNE